MKNLKVSMKLFVGFGIAIALIVFVGVYSIINMNNINNDYSWAIDTHGVPLGDAAHMLEAVHSLRAEARGAIIFTGKLDQLQKSEATINELFKKYEERSETFVKTVQMPESKARLAEAKSTYEQGFKPAVQEILEGAKKGLSIDELSKIMLAKAKPNADKVAENVATVIEHKQGLLKKANSNGDALTAKLSVIMILIIIAGAGVSVFFSLYIASLVGKPVSRLSELIGEWSRGRLDNKLNIKGRTDEIGIMAVAADQWVDDLNSLIISDGGKVLKAAAGKDLTQRLKIHYHGEYGALKTNINSLVQSLDAALDQVRETVMHVTSASSQIAAGAQSLAQGSSQQASSLEQVSSSLDEISSMTKQNAENSNAAKDLAIEARTAANEGDASMKEMAEAINQIKQSADNTAKIIKSIDDIAFQTNLLALNAAVEAARAGEAGKGFAVVAEEVRNLAMRSAEAAKNTANLIEQSVKNADNGVKITEEVAKSLTKIVDRAEKVGNLIAGIAAASNEQSAGIDQVTNAVSQMNQVTQSNASNAEESASAVEELNSLAEELQDLVDTFKLSDSLSGAKQRGGAKSKHPAPAASKDWGASASAVKQLPPPVKSVRAVAPEEIIPMDDMELHEF